MNLKTAAMPANVNGVHIDAAPYNASDGFSPGQAIVVKVPGLDTAGGADRTRARCRSTTSAASATPTQPIVVIDAETGKRWPIWAEIDSNATSPRGHGAPDQPGEELRLGPPLHRRPSQPEDRRRGHDRGARRIPLLPRPAARPSEPAINQRRGHFERIFQTLRKAGIERHEPLSRLGLHRRQRLEHRPARAPHARRRLRLARRHRPRRPEGRRAARRAST